MLGVRDIYDNKQKVGIIISYNLSNKINYGFNLNEVNIIKVINGEIVFTSLTNGGVFNLENNNWYIVIKALNNLIDISLEYTKILILNLNVNSKSYNLIKQIIEDRINNLHVKESDLKKVLICKQ